MPTLPWIRPEKPAPEADSDYLVFGSRFLVLNPAWSVRFMIGTVRLIDQMRHAEGCIALSLKADLLHGRFWTVSVWKAPEYLGKFAKTQPHAAISQGLAPAMKEVTFTTWKLAPSAEIPPTWREIQQRILAAKAEQDAAGDGQ
jgi:hypothetical protein